MAYYKKHNPSGAGLNVASSKERDAKVFERFSNMLIEKLESVKKSDWKKPWFTPGELSWPKALYGRDYHGMNAMMLMLHCEKEKYHIPVFATHEQLYSLNYRKDKEGNRIAVVGADGEKLPFLHVLKGEKSFPVFLSQVNVVHKDTKERIKWSDYVALSPAGQQDYQVYHNRRVYPVFNIEQTNIREARPALYARLEKENIPCQVEAIDGEEFRFAPIDTMIDRQLWICPVKVRELQAGDSPHYSISKNEIILGLKSQYVAGGRPESWVNDCFHEMIHSTGAAGCLDRLKPTRDRDSYATEEIVAEVGAALCCHRYGIPKTIKEDTIPYVQSWLDSLHEKPSFIRTVLKDVKLATSIVDSKIEKVRRMYLDAKEQEDGKPDLREDVEPVIEYDEDGDLHIGNGKSRDADKKQGEGERHVQEHSTHGENEESRRSGFVRR